MGFCRIPCTLIADVSVHYRSNRGVAPGLAIGGDFSIGFAEITLAINFAGTGRGAAAATCTTPVAACDAAHGSSLIAGAESS